MDIQTLISQRADENKTNEESSTNSNQPIINAPTNFVNSQNNLPILISERSGSNRSVNKEVKQEIRTPSRYCPLYIDMVWFQTHFDNNPANLFGLSNNSSDSFVFKKYSSGNLTNKKLNEIFKDDELKSIIYIYIVIYDSRGKDNDDELLPGINITGDKLDKHILIWDGIKFSDYGFLDVYVNVPKDKNIIPENNEFVTLGTDTSKIGSIYSSYINSSELQISLGKIWLGNKYNISIDDDKIKFSKIKLKKIPEKIQQLLDMGAKWPQEISDEKNALELNYNPDTWGNIYANLLLQVPNDNLDLEFKFTDNDFEIDNLDINGLEVPTTNESNVVNINSNGELNVNSIRDIPSYGLDYLFFNKETNEISFDSNYIPIDKNDNQFSIVSIDNSDIHLPVNITTNGETLLESVRDIPGHGLHPVLYNKTSSEISIDSGVDICEINSRLDNLTNIISTLNQKISDLEKNI